jgi:putative membrane protein
MSPPPSAVAIDPLLLIGIVAAGVPVADRLRRAGPGVSRWRWASLGGALALLVAILLTPVETVAQHYLLTAHLVQVLVVMGGAPPMLLLALPPAPARRWPGPLTRVGRCLTHPALAIVIVNVVFFLTHWTVAFDFGTRHAWFYDLSILALLGASIAFWWPIVNPDGRATLLSPLGKLGYILLATIPQTFAGLTVALAPRLLYDAYLGAPRLFDLSARADQQIAGACLAVLSKIALLAAFSVIFVRVMNPGQDGDDGGGGGGPRHEPAPSPPGEPAWYRAMRSGRLGPEPAPATPRPPLRTPVGTGDRSR